MKVFIIALIIALLIQTSFLPVNLCLLLLISRGLVNPEKKNFYLAFFAGIALGILSSINIGFYALVFLFEVEAASLLKKTPLTANPVTVLPIFLAFSIITALLEMNFLHQTINVPLIILQTLLALPVFILTKFWEERFVVVPPMKLKL